MKMPQKYERRSFIKMKKMKKFAKSGITVLLSVNMFFLTGCGGKGTESPRTELKSVTEKTAGTFGNTADTDTSGSDNSTEKETADFNSSDEGGASGWNGEVYKWSFEGDNGAALNGKTASIILADDSWVIASTTEGSLYMIEPFIYYTQEDSKIKSYKITDDSQISDLIYANQHMAYGKNHFVYFDMVQGYEDIGIDEVQPMDSFALPEIGYTFENVQKADLAEEQNLLYMTKDAAFCAYVDGDNHVRVNCKDSGGTYTTFSDVLFEGDAERNDVTVSKSIFQFLITDEQELFFIKKANTASDYSGNVQAVSISYIDLTDEVGAKARDIYNLQNYTYCCYVVDEEQNIYYVSVDMGDEVTVNKITQFALGTITDIQGFAGTNEKMLIETAEDGYYYFDGNGYVDTRRIDALNGDYKDVVLLMESDILALGNDGYLYVVENKN